MAVNLKTILKSTGIPTTYGRFKSAQTPPYVIYTLDDTDNLVADNAVYYTVENYRIELYSKDRDLVSEAKIESVLNANEISWDKSETYIEKEKLVLMVYEIQIR